MDTVVRGATVVTSRWQRVCDIGIADGKIAALSESIPGDARILDASGKLVLPGFIDPHTHMELPVAGTVSSDDFYTGTRAAVAGGITTIIDFCSQMPGQSFEDVLKSWKVKARKAIIDYGFHLIVPELTRTEIDCLGDVVQEGISTIKCMMAYKRGGQGSDDANLLRVMIKARAIGALPMVHAENGDAIDVLTDRLLEGGHTSPRHHPISRPSAVEAEAIRRAAMLSSLADYCVYIVHLSSADALHALRDEAAGGRSVYAETCPQYLTLDSSLYDRDDFVPAKYVCSPPLRTLEDREALWEGLTHGPLRLAASDHCPFFFQHQKSRGRNNFALIPNGIPIIELMFPLIYTEGVASGRMSLQRFVEISSTNSAKMFGLYPRKGEIEVGADADLVILDPEKIETISGDRLHSRCDYSPFEGRTVRGIPYCTMSRGEVLWQNNRHTAAGSTARGTFLRRRQWTGDPLV